MTQLTNQCIHALALIDGQHIRDFIARGGLTNVFGLFFVVYGIMVICGAKWTSKWARNYDLTRPENAPFARKNRYCGIALVVIGTCQMVIGLHEALGF
ncbi:MAG: hypothetical protein NT105_18720 [Verrucomicrobia bacterium]|nr:hypothetical protein [Verrucomicrobiota bacterium]